MHVNLQNLHFSIADQTLSHSLLTAAACFLSQVLTAIYPAQTMALTAGVIPVANMPTAVVSPSSPKATGMQNSVTVVPLPNLELESKVEVKREIQPEGQDEDEGYGYSSSTATCMVNATAGNSYAENKIQCHQYRICFLGFAKTKLSRMLSRAPVELDKCILLTSAC